MFKANGICDISNRVKACRSILNTTTMLLLIGGLSGTAQAENLFDKDNLIANDQAGIALEKMEEFSKLTKIETVELTYVKNNSSSLLAISDNQLLPTMTATKWSNGKYSLEGQGTYNINSPCLSYIYNADLNNKTYTLAPVFNNAPDDSSLKLKAMDSGINATQRQYLEEKGVSIETLANQKNNCLAQRSAQKSKKVIAPNAVQPGEYAATVELRTRDIFNTTITKTTNILEWLVTEEGTVDWLYWFVEWYAADPHMNRHWYVNYKDHLGPYFNTKTTKVTKKVLGFYYNDDWGNKEKETHIYQSVKIKGRNNASYNYYWSHIDWGENDLAIWGSITLN